jgi:radical SAM protein with 4Fe4S-binding SPASM domain
MTTKKLNLALARVSQKLRLSKPLNLPSTLMIEPTNVCNLKCPACPTGNGTLPFRKGYIKTDAFKNLIDDMGPYANHAQLWGFGEPFLHPDILQMVAYCKKYGLLVRISTNGQLLESADRAEEMVESGLDVLKVSLDGASQKTLGRYRVNASFDRIVAGIGSINAAKKKRGSRHPRVVLQFIVMRHNQHEIPIMQDLAAKFDMKYKQKTVWVEEDQTQDLLPDSSYSRFVVDPRTQRLRPARPQPRLCPYPWDSAMINYDGSVVPCCKDPYRYHLFGNAFEENYKSIWHSRAFVTFRKRLLADRSKVRKCNSCALPC